jgi:RNA polymerase-binding transcription factor DksA
MSTERDFEQAASNAERERAAGLARIRAALPEVNPESGPLVCDCGEPIDAARRQAGPGTNKCINCATFTERQRRRRA